MFFIVAWLGFCGQALNHRHRPKVDYSDLLFACQDFGQKGLSG